jgi:hypothetical protein
MFMNILLKVFSARSAGQALYPSTTGVMAMEGTLSCSIAVHAGVSTPFWLFFCRKTAVRATNPQAISLSVFAETSQIGKFVI